VKSKGVLHWVSIDHAVKVEVREYDRLFTEPSPLGHEGKDFLEFFNSDSLVINDNAFVEPSLKNAKPGDRFQFMRMGYYCLDEDSNDEHLVFNRTVTLKDTWAKVQKKNN
jgi:glutaminyl-tRNA synthetase